MKTFDDDRPLTHAETSAFWPALCVVGACWGLVAIAAICWLCGGKGP